MKMKEVAWSLFAAAFLAVLSVQFLRQDSGETRRKKVGVREMVLVNLRKLNELSPMPAPLVPCGDYLVAAPGKAIGFLVAVYQPSLIYPEGQVIQEAFRPFIVPVTGIRVRTEYSREVPIVELRNDREDEVVKERVTLRIGPAELDRSAWCLYDGSVT